MNKNQIVGIIVLVVAVILVWRLLPIIVGLAANIFYLIFMVFLALVVFYIVRNLLKRNS